MKNLITPPALLPVTLAEAKTWIGEDSDYADADILRLIGSAVNYIENYTNRRLVEQVWEETYAFCYKIMGVSYPPTISVDSVTYYDVHNSLQTMSSDNYHVIPSTNGKTVIEIDTLPMLYGRQDAFIVRFTAGYETLPDSLHTIIRCFVRVMYDAKGADWTPLQIAQLNAMLDQYQGDFYV